MARRTKAQREAEARVTKRAACYIAESDLKNEQVKADLALQAAGLHEQYWIVLMRSMTGQGKAEESRTLPALASNYARIMDRLGAAKERLSPEDEEL